MDAVLGLLSGALVFAYVLAGAYFLRFWRKTRDALFLSFAVAFWLFAVNRTVLSLLGDADERAGPAYVLRVLGFALILFAIVQKNVSRAPGKGENLPPPPTGPQ